MKNNNVLDQILQKSLGIKDRLVDKSIGSQFTIMCQKMKKKRSEKIKKMKTFAVKVKLISNKVTKR